MSVLDHLSIIEAICKHLDFETLRSMLFVSKKCARCFKESDCIQRNLSRLMWLEGVKGTLKKLREMYSDDILNSIFI